MDEDRTEKGFTVKDRRIFTEEGKKREVSEGEKSKTRAATGKEREEKPGQQQKAPLPEVNFSTFIFSLSSSALAHLGEVPDPVSGKRNEDLDLAKQTIDILGMLEEKTQGNLTAEEDSLLKSILYDLRLRFVKKKSSISKK